MSKPKSVGDAIDEAAAGLFGTLDNPLRLKCRYLYAHEKIKAIQDRDETPGESLMAKYREIEEKLIDLGCDSSTVLY